jgi:hypothetical protein
MMSCHNYKNLSIGFWNIDGLYEGASNLRTCKLDYKNVKENLNNFDIIGLVETHCGPDEIINLHGYKTFLNCREKNNRNNRYYGGISVLIKTELLQGVKLIKSTNSEIQWIKLLKSFFNVEEDIYLCTVYIAPKNSGFTINTDDDIFSILESDIIKFSKQGHCMVMGDFNARTSSEPDNCTNDNLNLHLDIPVSVISSKHLPRINSDKSKVDTHGSNLLSLCKSSDLRILNGRTLGDSLGHPTCYSHNGAPSVIDYTIVSENLLPIINYFHVHDPNHNSIHCILSIVINATHSRKVINDSLDPLPKKYIWKDPDSVSYRNAMTSHKVQSLISNYLEISNNPRGSVNSDTINSSLNSVNEIFYEAASGANIKMLWRKSTTKNHTKQKINSSTKAKHKNWFDNNCHRILRDLTKLGSLLRKDPFNKTLLLKYKHDRKMYKKLVQHKKASFQNKIIDKLSTMENEQPKAFWKLFDDLNSFHKKSKQNPVSSEDWIKHFQSIMCKNVEDDLATSNIRRFIRDKSDNTFNELNFQITPNEII